MKKNITRVVAVATLATTLVAGIATSAFATGTSKTQDNGSYGPLFLFDSSVQDPTNTFAFDADVYAAGSSANGANTTVDCPASTTAYAFASARGSESTKIDWKASTSLAFFPSTTNVKQGNVKLSGLTVGSPNDLKASGVATRDWSVGIACVSGSSDSRVYYRYITVTTASGDWTAAASDYVYPTPTLTYTKAGATFHTGDTVNAVIDANAIPDGFSVAYQWYANGTAITLNGTGASYTTVANDAGKHFTVDAIYTRSTYTTVTKTSANSDNVQGDAVTSGTVTVNASVVAPTPGQLSLDVANGASATLTGALNGSNKSVSTGSLPDLTVKDGRIDTMDGWDLTASVSDFQKGSDIIGKSQLGIAPSISSRPTDGNAVANTARVAGAAFTSDYTLASSAKITGGTTDKTYVGDTVVTGTLTLVAPQWKPAGTYSATMTVTVTSK
jgi:hypothetical protein